MANSITEITTHAADAVAELPAQYVDAALLRAVVETLGDRAQYIETALWSMLTESLPSSASTAGAQLDKFGDLVGQSRAGGDYPAGESDALYRQKLAAAAQRNRSAGTSADVLGVLASLLNGNLTIGVLLDTPPAAFQLLVVVGAALSAAEQAMVREFIERTRAAGIGATYATYDGPVFGFDDGTGYSWIGGWGTDWATFF